MKILKTCFPEKFKILAVPGACVALFLATMSGAVAADTGDLSTNALMQIQALQAEKDSFTPVEQKMDSQLVFAFKQSMNLPIANGAVPQLRIGVKPDTNGLVKVDITANVTTNLLDQIRSSGGTIINNFPQFNAIRALVPLNQVEYVAGLADVKFVQPAIGYRKFISDPEGVAVHQASLARNTFHVDGSGIKLGVISDSVDFLAQAQALGDLGPVNVLPGQSGVPGTGEGSAMLEIVHAMAPGTELFFATADPSPAAFAQNILNLRAAGCDIIVDDIQYQNESPFQDGVIAQAVSTVTANGALYFSAAGNSGNLDSQLSGTWEGDFVKGGTVTTSKGTNVAIHTFGGTTQDTVTLNSAEGAPTVLFWSDPLGASSNDYDLYVFDTTGANVISASLNSQNGSQDPIEFVPFPFPGQRVAIVQASGTNCFLHLDTGGGILAIGTSGNTRGHNASTNAFSVAAVDVATAFPNPFTGGGANPVETFSSDGLRRMFYLADGTPLTPGNFSATGGVLYQKPDIAAADGVTTSVPGFAPFHGTSAAAPHAASIAALLKSYNPSLTPAQVRTALTSSALDIMAPGVDRDSGVGIVMPYPAMQAAPPPPPSPFFVVVTNIVTGGNGNGVIDSDECNSLDLVLTNSGTAGASGVQATLSTTTPKVFITQRTVAYSNIPTNGVATNLTSFKISTSPAFVCGTPIDFTLVVKSDQITRTNLIQLTTGTSGSPIRFDSSVPVNIPDNTPVGASSGITVSGMNTAIAGLSVSVNILHPFVADLALQLIGPDGTVVSLSQHHGGFGADYGIACSPEGNRTTFNDAAGTPIASGNAPFLGTFQPEQPLASFVGKTGPGVNGLWQLHVVDDAFFFTGTIECWSLILSPAACTDGGGPCPGIDLAVGMTASPNPVVLQSPITYNISITNNGPDAAKSVVLNQSLPSNITFVSGTPSQGSVTFSSGTVSASLGILPVGATATVTVIVVPNTPGTIFSTATVGAIETDTDPSNNSISVATQVNVPTADLSVSLNANPNPVLLGGVLTYTTSITNSGPASASNVIVTNVLPQNVSFIAANSSQGSSFITGGNVVASLGSLASGGSATLSVQVRATVVGTITSTSSASSGITDPLTANNTSSVTSTIAPASDLKVTMVSSPTSAIVGGNVTNTVTVMNQGPTLATSVTLSDTLPPTVTFGSAQLSQGTSTQSGGVVTCNMGSLAVGASATVKIIYGTAPLAGHVPVTLTNVATVSASQADPNSGDNSASATTRVDIARPVLVSAGAVLGTESFAPANGFIDPNETVTVKLSLQNIGNLDTANLVATLLGTGGVVTNTAQVRTFGIVHAGGSVGTNSFTFTANGTNGGTIIATLQLQDGTNNLGTAQFTFVLPTIATFANTADIIIPDSGPATNYPSGITVSGLTGLIDKVTVTLTNVNHTYPDDVDILLVGPANQTVLLMSHAGGGGVMTNVSLTFDDGAASGLPAASQILTGSYKPSQYGTVSFPPSAPSGQYGTALSTFNGTNANGLWNLYVLDSSPGDQGIILGGWSMAIATGAPVNQTEDLAIMGTSVPNPVLAGANLTYIFSITNNGPDSANSVVFTNVLPANVNFISAVSSQGTCVNASGVVSCLVGSLGVGTNVTITVVVTPTAPGVISSHATVSTVDTDLNQSNNSTTVVTTANAPVADLGLSLSSVPNPVVIGSNLVYTITVTNSGPGTALGVIVTDPLGSSTLVSGFSSPALGTPFSTNGTATCKLGDLAPGTGVVVTLVVTPAQLGAFTNIATASTLSSDQNLTNNSASAIISVVNPAPTIIAVGAKLLAESSVPSNGTIDVGETVTVALTLTNGGSADTAQLAATLLATGGVSPSSQQSYGALIHGGAAVTRPFTFTASGVSGGIITATLALQDGTTNLGTVVFSFKIPGSAQLANGNPIVVPENGPATPYPSTINISSVTGLVSKATVTISNLSHSFPNDIEVLLVAPSGRATVLMAGTGGPYSITNVTLTFDDAAASTLPVSNPNTVTPIVSGTFQPSDFGLSTLFPSPAPAGPYSTKMATLNGTDPNGTWSLYVFDDSPGDAGTIAGGWSLNLTTVNPVNSAADLAVTIVGPSVQIYTGSNFTYSVSVTNRGPATATGATVTDNLPGGLNFVSTSLGSFTLLPGGVNLPLAGLASGTATNFTITVNAPAAGVYNNRVIVAADQTDLDLSDNNAQSATTVVPPPASSLAPQLGATSYANGTFSLTLTGQTGQTYVIQASTDLKVWTPVSTNVASGGVVQFNDTNAVSFPYRYYRAFFTPGN